MDKLKRVIYLLQTLLFLIFALNGLYAQEEEAPKVIPMIKTPFPVHCVTWDKDGTTFAYAEESKIIVRDGQNYSLLQVIDTTDGDVQYLQFSKSTSGDGLNQIASLSKDNVLEIRILPNAEPRIAEQIDPDSKPTALAYSYNGNFLATSDSNSDVYIFMQQYYTNTLIERKSRVLTKPATTLNFSPDNKLLAIGSQDNVVYIVDVASGLLLYSVKYKNALNIPVAFTVDSQYIIVANTLRQLLVTDFAGNVVRKIKTKKNIASFAVSSDGKNVLVVGTDNKIYFYSLETGKMVGYIPAYNYSPITSYVFSNTTEKLLVGHEDGAIYILDVNDVLLQPWEKAPDFKLYVADDATSLKGQQVSSKDLNKNAKKSLYKSGQTITIDAGCSFLPDPFVMTARVGVGYRNYGLIQPFYFGGEIEPFIGFPSSDFPYTYSLNGGTLKNPFILGGKIYVPFGFAVKPFSNDISVFAEVAPGANFSLLWNRRFGTEAITNSRIFPSFNAQAKVGVAWKFINFAVCGEYDTMYNFSCSATLGFSIDLKGGGMR